MRALRPGFPGFASPAGASPSASQSGTRRALSMFPASTANGWPSTSNSIRSPSTATMVPVSRRRPSWGSYSPTLAFSPTKRANWAGVNSGRSTPGEDTSSV